MMRAGVHLPNDGRMSEEDLVLVEGLRLVKGLVRLDCDWGEVDWGRLAGHLRADCTVILRLFFPGWLEPGEFVTRSVRKLPGIIEALGGRTHRSAPTREILVEIHNEPNHAEGIEGWGKSDADARDFRSWYRVVFTALRRRGFHNLGWPGLALGPYHRERMWAEANRYNIRDSDWIGVHCYWQRESELGHQRLGRNWEWYRRRWPNRRICVTEVANSSCHNPELPQMTPERQRSEYLEWCRQAAAGGVLGAAFYMLGGTEDWRGFRLWPETVREISRYARNDSRGG